MCRANWFLDVHFKVKLKCPQLSDCVIACSIVPVCINEFMYVWLCMVTRSLLLLLLTQIQYVNFNDLKRVKCIIVLFSIWITLRYKLECSETDLGASRIFTPRHQRLASTLAVCAALICADFYSHWAQK